MVGGGGGSSRIAGRNQPVADPDLQIGGRGGGHPDPEIRGKPGLKKIFFSALRASVWSKNKRGGGWAPLGFSPGSATGNMTLHRILTSPRLCLFVVSFC